MLCDTGLPMIPNSLVSLPCDLNPYSCCSWAMVGCPGADARSGERAAKVRTPPYLAASSRVMFPFSPIARAMVGPDCLVVVCWGGGVGEREERGAFGKGGSGGKG